jgi:hypothetical protein
MSDAEQRIADLERRVSELERRDATRRVLGPFEAKPATQPLPYPEPYQLPLPWCVKCGLKLGEVMGYVCPNAGCPTGLGGAICAVFQG